MTPVTVNPARAMARPHLAALTTQREGLSAADATANWPMNMNPAFDPAAPESSRHRQKPDEGLRCGTCRSLALPWCAGFVTKIQPLPSMTTLPLLLPPVAAIGWSLLYLLFGGGLVGAILIFIIAKIFRK